MNAFEIVMLVLCCILGVLLITTIVTVLLLSTFYKRYEKECLREHPDFKEKIDNLAHIISEYDTNCFSLENSLSEEIEILYKELGQATLYNCGVDIELLKKQIQKKYDKLQLAKEDCKIYKGLKENLKEIKDKVEKTMFEKHPTFAKIYEWGSTDDW